MPSIVDILERFRRTGASPGAPAPAGVPRDRKSELSAELQEVFGQVDAIEAEAEAIVGAGNREAERIRNAARLEAQEIVDAARAAVPGVRTRAAAERRRERGADMQSLTQEAQRQIAAVREQAAVRMPALVDRVLADLMREAAQAPSQNVEFVGRR